MGARRSFSERQIGVWPRTGKKIVHVGRGWTGGELIEHVVEVRRSRPAARSSGRIHHQILGRFQALGGIFPLQSALHSKSGLVAASTSL